MARQETATSNAPDKPEGDARVRTSLWILNTIAVTVLAFLLGYGVSQSTGIEPGFFEAAETGGYGAGAAATTEAGGLSEELQRYYQDLAK